MDNTTTNTTDVGGRLYMTDHRGRLVPRELIPPIDLIRDELVKKLVHDGECLARDLRRYRDAALSEIKSFVALSASEYDLVWGGKKGNLQLISYDGSFKIQVSIAEYFVFDERLQIAKQLIDECLVRWTETSGDEVRTLIQDAFQVDKIGRVNSRRIMGLRRLAIDDEQWKKAMEAISDALQVVASKEYFRLYRRVGVDKWEMISLDIAAM